MAITVAEANVIIIEEGCGKGFDEGAAGGVLDEGKVLANVDIGDQGDGPGAWARLQDICDEYRILQVCKKVVQSW